MKKMLVVILIVLFGLVGLAYAQSAKDAYKALKKVEARVETGVSYKDYPQVIADAKAEVNMFLEGKEAQKNPQMAQHMKKAMDYYMTAGEIWDIKFSMGSVGVLETLAPDMVPGRKLKRLYPEARAEPYPGTIGPCYVMSNILREIWGKASKELKMVQEYLKT